MRIIVSPEGKSFIKAAHTAFSIITSVTAIALTIFLAVNEKNIFVIMYQHLHSPSSMDIFASITLLHGYYTMLKLLYNFLKQHISIQWSNNETLSKSMSSEFITD